MSERVAEQVASAGGESRSPTEPDAASARPPEPARRQRSAEPRAPADPTHPILDAPEAAWFLRYSTLKAFYQAVHRYGIPHARRGARVMLFRRADLEKFLAARTRSL